jgi:hypothetical protein
VITKHEEHVVAGGGGGGGGAMNAEGVEQLWVVALPLDSRISPYTR